MFAALLGGSEHGRWLIAPEDPCPRVQRRYRDGTLILETDWETADGAATVIDFMRLGGGRPDLIRLVVGRRGELAMRAELVMRFDYGLTAPWVTRLEDGQGLRAVAGPDMVVLRTETRLRGEDLTTVGDFTVQAGETVAFTLSHGASHLEPPVPLEPQQALVETEHAWRQWSSRCQYQGEWSEAVRSSHIVLKALTYAPTGGIVAAPTTSLPEKIGGSRNWDYRYCWLRDATFALLSLLNAGYVDEARAWREWLLRAAAGSPAQAQIMYGLAGERRLPELALDWLPGYERSRPVRIGNAAAGQLQLDVYGEVMDAFYQARCADLDHNQDAWALQTVLVEHLETIWDKPDEGIWETRGGRQQFTHSKVMAWVAFDRAVRSVDAFGLPGPADRWRRLRRDLHEDICRNGFDDELNSFVQAYGSKRLDASLLLLPLVGFLPPEDPRVRGTIAAVEQRLLSDGLVVRYDTADMNDGLPPGEGAFLACSFWLADNLVLQGRRPEARTLFERLLDLRNDVGLLAEQYDPIAQRQLGNFPQAFSHLALADTARNLSMAGRPAAQRGRQRHHAS